MSETSCPLRRAFLRIQRLDSLGPSCWLALKAVDRQRKMDSSLRPVAFDMTPDALTQYPVALGLAARGELEGGCSLGLLV